MACCCLDKDLYFYVFFQTGSSLGVGKKTCDLLCSFMNEINEPSWCFSCNATTNASRQPLKETRSNSGYS